MVTRATGPSRSVETEPSDAPTGGRPPRIGKWVWITLAIVAAVEGAVLCSHWWFEPAHVRETLKPIDELPLEIAGWKGKSVELDDRLVRAVGATQVLNRMYTSGRQSIAVHLATFDSAEHWLPHTPESCYVGNGWRRIERHPLPLPGGDGQKFRVGTYEQNGSRVLVAFWFQLGDRAYVDLTGAREVRRRQAGRQTWPPVVKVLLQINDPDTAPDRYTELAGAIYAFLRGV